MPVAVAVDHAVSVMRRRVFSRLWLFELRTRGVEIGTNVTVLGRPIVTREAASIIALGSGVTLVSHSRDTALGVSRPVVLRTLHPDAEIHIGSDSGLSGTTICAAHRVSMGERVLIGADVLIADTDFHPVDQIPRRYGPIPATTDQDAVVIEDDVFVGARAIILKGVTIGRASVIGSGSVVTDDIPPETIAAGIPCRPIRRLSLLDAGRPGPALDV